MLTAEYSHFQLFSDTLISYSFSSTEPLTPSNVEVKRTSPKTIQVTWEESGQENLISMYRVFYFNFASPDMTIWDYTDTDGPTTVAQITGLEAHMTYAVRVQAKSVNDRWSNMTEVKIVQFAPTGTTDVLQKKITGTSLSSHLWLAEAWHEYCFSASETKG